MSSLVKRLSDLTTTLTDDVKGLFGEGSAEAAAPQQPAAYNPVSRGRQESVKRTTMHGAIDVTQINTNLYNQKRLPSSQKANVELGDEVKDCNRGSIQLVLYYKPDLQMFTVRVDRVSGLPPRPELAVFCRLQLLPDRNEVQTKTIKGTQNPVFDEELLFEIAEDDLANRVLELTVHNKDQSLRGEVLGVSRFTLADQDFTQSLDVVRPLTNRAVKDGKTYGGDLLISFNYLKASQRLTVDVREARDLRINPDGAVRQFEPLVKVCVTCEGKKKKRKTTTQHAAVAPVWNEALVFTDLSEEQLPRISLDIEVVHDSILERSPSLGSVTFSVTLGGGALHWQHFLKTGDQTPRWHRLALT